MSRVPIRLPSPRSKYRAVRTEVDGMKFASKKEAERYQELKILERAGKISDLRRQVKFEIMPQDEMGRAIHYIGDFAYTNSRGVLVVEDVKGIRTGTPVYRLKRRMMWQMQNIWIQEV